MTIEEIQMNNPPEGMSTFKHTPGPWQFVERETLEDGSVFPAHIIGGVTQLHVCLMESPAVADAIVNDPAWRALANSEMRHANARLIAAAPELLEALHKLVDSCADSDGAQYGTLGTSFVRSIATAAIAKVMQEPQE